MEQTNLVVTPDGKTWDEVTRNTSYLGNASLYITASGGADHGTDSISLYNVFRGGINTKANCIQKRFAIAYDRYICLESGEYRIQMNFMTASAATAKVLINGTVVLICDNLSTRVSGQLSPIVTLQKGDYVQTSGGYLANDDFTHFSIHKL
jgi:hypothetical protein